VSNFLQGFQLSMEHRKLMLRILSAGVKSLGDRSFRQNR
jgi:hypothetical protein